MKYLFILLFLPIICFGQPKFPGDNKYPFNLKVLEELSAGLVGNDTIIPVGVSGKFQYINSHKKKVAIHQMFDEAYPLYFGYGLVQKDGLYGIIKSDGAYIVKPQFKSFELIQDLYIKFTKDQYFTFDGKMLYAEPYHGGEPVFPLLTKTKVGRKYQLVIRTYSATAINNINERKIGPAIDSVILIGYEYAIVRQKGKIGAIDTAGHSVIPFRYSECVISALGFALRKLDTWSYYYFNREVLFKSKFKPVYFGDNIFIYQYNGLYNYLNDRGKVILPRYYKWISESGRLGINQNDELVLLNNKHEEFVYYRKE